MSAILAEATPGRCPFCDGPLPSPMPWAKRRVRCDSEECAHAYQVAYGHDKLPRKYRWRRVHESVDGIDRLECGHELAVSYVPRPTRKYRKCFACGAGGGDT